MILFEIEVSVASIEGRKLAKARYTANFTEDEITETFVRGSGAGGQKVNKTSNKVLLIHNPTNIRVECQETRSLHQNRKIARKRLKSKLDEFFNGSLSRTSLKATKLISKKSKVKSRNKARQKKRQASKGKDKNTA